MSNADELCGWTARKLRDAAGYLPINYEVMRELGPPSLVFVAICELCQRSNRETFAAVETIGERAGFAMTPANVKRVRRYIAALHGSGWLDHLGRQRRRTVTYRVPDARWTLRHGEKYATLPLCFKWTHARSTYMLVFATIVSELAAYEAAEERERERRGVPYSTPLRGCGAGYPLSVRRICNLTGLARQTVSSALAFLEKRKLFTGWRDGPGKTQELRVNWLLDDAFPFLRNAPLPADRSRLGVRDF